MIISGTRKRIQKLIILATLLAGLTLLSVGTGTTAAKCGEARKLPCCSYCDDHPDAQICSHGCLFGCRSRR